jgi:hypothetical protein
LQPDENDTNRFYIPAGIYKCVRWHSEKHPNTFQIICPPHIALLFHSGNVEADSLGCILLGSSRGKLGENRAILNSGNTFKIFLEKTAEVDSFQLELIDNY